MVAGGVLISTNDTTILAMLSRYPDISVAEQDEYISKIQYEENIPICLAVVGRISKEELTPSARGVFDEFSRWSVNRTRMFKNEQVSDRYRMKENRTAIRMAQLHQQGKISDQVMMLYGISGDLPERIVYAQLTETEKRELWEERMVSRLGPQWRRHVSNLPAIFCEIQHGTHNWLQEGF